MYAKQLKKLNTDQLKNRLKQKDKPYMLIDVRDAEAYYKGHIPGACSLFDAEIMSLAKGFDKNMPIIVYGPGSVSKTRLCDDAAEKFISMGFKNVCAYENGLEGWADAGNRVDRSEKKMTCRHLLHPDNRFYFFSLFWNVIIRLCRYKSFQ